MTVRPFLLLVVWFFLGLAGVWDLTKKKVWNFEKVTATQTHSLFLCYILQNSL